MMQTLTAAVAIIHQQSRRSLVVDDDDASAMMNYRYLSDNFRSAYAIHDNWWRHIEVARHPDAPPAAAAAAQQKYK